MIRMNIRIILHSDLNSFYASVECLYHPEIRSKPVAVGGDVEKRHGIVLAKNELAKKYNVQTGEALWQAKLKCPDIIFIKPNFNHYIKYSKLVKKIYEQYTNKVEAFGLDECWLDISSIASNFDEGKIIADEIRAKVFEQLGVTVSIGVSWNKIFAKLASDMKKPDATTVISKENYKEIAWPLPASDLLYVGRATNKKLKTYGIKTIGDLANTSADFLKSKLGKNGLTLWIFANGWENSPVTDLGDLGFIKSIGNSTTAPRDLITDNDVKITLHILCESVSSRLREHNFFCRTVQIYIRDNELSSYQRQGTFTSPVNTSQQLFKMAYLLYVENQTNGKPVRSIGVRACNLLSANFKQTSFLEEAAKAQKQEDLERTVDIIRRRFGFKCLQRGLMLTDKHLSDLNPKDDHLIHPESFF